MNRGSHRNLELLAPARNAEIAIEAILHGADAVYMGPPGYGARKAASNSIEDIKRVVDFAHIFNARVYVTVNTIIYENELKEVEKMIRQLYRIGVDALIIQDMGILRMDIPPIELHASTQCDIRTPEKAIFLQDVGFSQLVLARELTLDEIKAVTSVVEVPVEVFVHGALCVSYSGRCQAGFVYNGRSGNRGECSQICRLPFTLKDGDGKILKKNRHLLSLKDLNRIDNLNSLIEAGATSLKIEGRLKELPYIKNVVTAYSQQLDRIVRESGGKLRRSSFGTADVNFRPSLEKSFNRGFTNYFLNGVTRNKMASFNTPKSIGEPIDDINLLNPGDGISYFDKEGKFDGLLVNGIKDGKIIGNRPFKLPKGVQIYRTSDVKWEKLLSKKTAERKLNLSVRLDSTGISASDETGAYVRIPLGVTPENTEKEFDYGSILGKLGNTPFRLYEFENEIGRKFVPASLLSSRKREMVETLLKLKRIRHQFGMRRKEDMDVQYPSDSLESRDNVSNSLAERFYRDHGVKKIEPALETLPASDRKGRKVMTTRYCLLREMGLCLKKHPGAVKQPLTLTSNYKSFRLGFDCKRCEMSLTSLS